MPTPKPIVNLIQANQQRRDPVLDLRGRTLLRVPEEIRGLDHLEQLLLGENAIQTLPEWLADLPRMEFIQLNQNPLRELNGVANLVLDQGVWWRLRPDPAQVAGLWLRWMEGDWLEAAKKLHLRWLDLSGQRLRECPGEIARWSDLRVLNLRDNRLTRLPVEIAQLQNLATLDLSWNGLSKLPPEIAQLQNLATLDLENTGLSKLPPEIAQLQNLATLHLSNNQLSTLPPEIAQLQNLATLNLAYTGLSTLPLVLAQLQNLATLDLTGNGLSTLPPEIAQLQNLATLNLERNQLRTLPPEIAQLQNLATLNLRNNQLSTLPPEIAQLQNLATLDLRDNGLRTLPPEIAQLHDLRTLALKDNPLETPPLESLDLEGLYGNADLTQLHAWFRDAQTQGLVALQEAKLLIIGDGDAGKTTLARRLMDPEAALPEKNASTEGLDVWRWNLEGLRLNVWDFGGQEVFHATHQFFFSDSALYALVADGRSGKTDFYWWLNVVEKFGKQSPVFLVKNERDRRNFPIPDLDLLRRRFGDNLDKMIFRLPRFEAPEEAGAGNDPQTEPEVDWRQRMLDFVAFQARQLPHLRKEYPRFWLNVRDALAQEPTPYITLEHYRRICAAHGLDNIAGDALLSLLHNLGACLYFAEFDALRKTVILKPTWATEAVYRVLDDKTIQHDRGDIRRGRFSTDDVVRIWRTPKNYRHSVALGEPVQCHWNAESYADMHTELLAMMVAFELCFALPQKGEYIAPQLLEPTPPDGLTFPKSGGLTMKYDFTGFMPKGLVNRLAVQLHDWIEAERQFVWQTGVVFGHHDARAEVTESQERREIVIRILGRNPRDLSSVILHRLDRILAKFYKLEYTVWVPCQCARKEKTGYFEREKLHQFAHDRKAIQCQECYDLLNARDLLDGVLRREDEEKSPGGKYQFLNARSVTIYENGEHDMTEEKIKSTWGIGLFYLLVFVVVMMTFPWVTGGDIPWWSLPIVIIGGLPATIAIGALELRKNEALHQTKFIELMAMVLRQLPLLEKLMPKPKK